MSIDHNSIAYFADQAERHGSVVLEGLPLDDSRFMTASGMPQTSLMVAQATDGTFAVLVPEDLTPRSPEMARPFAEGTCVQGWRILAIPAARTAAEALGCGSDILGLQSAQPEELPREAHADTEAPGSADGRSAEVRVPASDENAHARRGELPFTRDLTMAARRGELLPVHGRDHEVEQAVTILLQSGKNCPLLVGDPGVGKTAVVEKLAILSAGEGIHPRLAGMRVLALDIAHLLAESGQRGGLEKNLQQLLDGLEGDPRLLLFADEIHTLADARGDLSVFEIMKPRLARGLRVAGATTHAEFKQKVAPDQALVRRFDLISVSEPSQGETKDILLSRLPGLESHHQVRVDPDIVAKVVRLADEYFPDRRRPDKALTLLDRAMAAESMKIGAPGQ